MPYINNDDEFKTNKNFDLIFHLKEKGQKIKFRIIGKSYYEGKHFLKNPDGSWNIVACERININAPCDYCEEYFRIIKESRITGDKALMEEGIKKAEPWKCALAFYIPIIDRDNQDFKVLKVGLGIRGKLEAEVKMGTPIMERDFVILRTEKPGSDYYTLSKVDSADTQPFTPKELEEVEKFKSMDLVNIVGGKVDKVGEPEPEVDIDEISKILS